MILTHLNVGFRDHPLQTRYPPLTAGVTIGRGAFVGAGATILPTLALAALYSKPSQGALQRLLLGPRYVGSSCLLPSTLYGISLSTVT